MRKLLLFIMLTSSAWGQGICHYNMAFKDTGRPAPLATIHVGQDESTGTPPSPLATVYTTEELTTPKSNPFTADSLGNYAFCAPAGTYKVQISGTGLTTLTLDDVLLPSAQIVETCDTFSGATAGAKIQACIDALPSTGGTADARGFEGAQTISASITISKKIDLLLGAATFSASGADAFVISADGARVVGIQGATKITMESDHRAFDITGDEVLLENLEIRAGVDTTKAAIRSTNVVHQTLRDIFIHSDDPGPAPYTQFATGVEWQGVIVSLAENVSVHDASAQAFYCYRSSFPIGCNANTFLNVDLRQPPSEAQLPYGLRLENAVGFTVVGGNISGRIAKGFSCTRTSAISTHMVGSVSGTWFEPTDQGGGETTESIWMQDCSYVRIESVMLGGTVDTPIHLTGTGLQAHGNVLSNLRGDVDGITIDANVLDTLIIGGRHNSATFIDNGTRTARVFQFDGTTMSTRLGSGFEALFFADLSASPALSGFVRAGNNVCGVNWRNAANSSDICLAVNASDDILLGASSNAGDIVWFSKQSFRGTFTHANTGNRGYNFPDVTGEVPVLPTAATTESGTGAIARVNTPTLITPVLGAATGTSIVLSGDASAATVTLTGGPLKYRDVQALAASTTPSVAAGNVFSTASTASITNFTGGVNGQVITLLCGADTTTSLTDSTPLFLNAAFTCTANDSITLIFNGSVWYEVARSAN